MLKAREDLIYDLIFSEVNEYNINISDYIEDIYKYDRFIDDIKTVLKKSKVSIIKENIELDESNVIWNLKVKK
jgi:hypothetical protein